MKRRTFLLISVVLPLAFGQVTGVAVETKSTKTIRLLTVGNSFSQNATHYLGDIAKAAGNTLVHHPAAIGGATMQQHWDKAQLFEQNPSDPHGLYATKKSLSQELQAEPWDFITMQQACIRSHDVTTYRPYAGQLYGYFKKYAPRSEEVLHQTNGKLGLGMDGHHANAAGEYLAACVWYEVFFQDSAVGNSFAPEGIEPTYARFLQETAHRAVTGLAVKN